MTKDNSIFPDPPAHLKDEYERVKAILAAQTAIVQRFIEAQARQIAEALIDSHSQVKFTLPDRVIIKVSQLDEAATVTVPESNRNQQIGGLMFRLSGKDLKEEVRHRLNELEQSPDQAISNSTSLLRYAVAQQLVYSMLPSGRSVEYRAVDGESIPSIPTADLEPESAITQASDAIAQEGKSEAGRGDFQVPFVPAARRFYLPQWVAFDDADNLLAGTEKEAEAHVVSMQRYINILHMASSLAPYFIVDEEYQKKRYGMLGQLINQGRALARYKVNEMIRVIKERAKAGTLNRGLSLSIPYFDDQDLKLETSHLEIVPAGRIMFVPAFVVRAAREEAAKRAQDTRFNDSTRNHLMNILQALENAFTGSAQ